MKEIYASMPLTLEERAVIDMLGNLYEILKEIVGNSETREADLAEMAHHIHVLQRYMMAQAMCRTYPGACRGLGETISPYTAPRKEMP